MFVELFSFSSPDYLHIVRLLTHFLQKDENPKFFVHEGGTYVPLKESIVLFADFAMKVVGEIWPKDKGKLNTVVNSVEKGQEGQWLMSCTGHSFSRKETRFALFLS